MGKVVAVVGNSGVGKTTFTRLLCEVGKFSAGLEAHEDRLFQKLFAGDLQAFALPNQMDFLIYRAEQERAIRQGPQTGIIDGGLDMDFQVFTRHFYACGYLDQAGFELCSRLYKLLRALLPPPDLTLWLTAPPEVAAERHARRRRGVEIAQPGDLEALDALLQTWLETRAEFPVIKIDASRDDPTYIKEVSMALERIREIE